VYNKILIANRGEIALRVIRACRELGIPSVAVYSEADRDSLHVRFADEAVCIGPPQGTLSYLKYQSILAAAEITDADAIHPGYGFLAENAEFAEMCLDSGVSWIGPPPHSIRSMGDKSNAKDLMTKARVPVTPGSDGPVGSLEETKRIAKDIGFPIILKASAGGGGRGMRMVEEASGVQKAYDSARAEAGSAFGNPELYLEKFIVNPRHIEIQLMGDSHGNVVHLGERDCSIQRRHQKLIEESPSPAVSPELRKKLGDAAVMGAAAVNYVGAGTMEFLLTPDRDFYFMEMNTRIQVEHPVTEAVTGRDLVAEQIRTCAGEKLRWKQKDIHVRGHSIEFRINAEDPSHNFRPGPGMISDINIPGGLGVRVDTHIYSGYSIPPFYDSLIAKLIVHGEDRPEAIARGRRTLEEFVVEGIPTTIPFHLQILDTDEFQSGDVSTSFLEDWMARLDQA